MFTIQYVNAEGVIETGPEYTKLATAELAATWRSMKRNQKWIAIEKQNTEAAKG